MESSEPEGTSGKAKSDQESEQATIQYLMGTLENLQRENELLRRQASKAARAPSGKIGFTLLAVGALTLIGSYVVESAVLAFIGLGLTFWGALFLFARPIKFVKGTLLDSTAIASYATIDRMIQDLDYKGRPVYIPPYPREAYLPEYLKGLKDMLIFIPAEEARTMPTIEEMAKRQFLLKNPKGICLAPPGYGLLTLFEKELKTEFTQIDLDRLYNSLPTIIVKNLELAKELEINPENDLIHVRMIGPVYKELYAREHGFQSVHGIGCPLASAIASALAKTTGRLVTLVKDHISPDLEIIDIWYRTVEA